LPFLYHSTRKESIELSAEVVSLQPVKPVEGKVYSYEEAERARRVDWVRKQVFLNHKYSLISNPLDPRLYAPNKKIRDFSSLTVTENAKQLVAHHIIENGAGLAAPQIGLNWRMFTMTLPGPKFVVFFNPRIVLQPGEESNDNVDWGAEGCLSHPGISLEVARLKKVTIVASTLAETKEHKYHFEGVYARVVQHEISHLEGKLITDMPGHLRRNLIVHKTGQEKLFAENRHAEEHGFIEPEAE
jgi:peptide deformylase